MKIISVSLATFFCFAGLSVLSANAAECAAFIPAGVTVRLLPDENLAAGTSTGPTIFTVATDIRFFPNRPPLIARGSKVMASIVESRKAGRLFGRARLGLTLNSILTSDFCEYPIDAKIVEAGRQNVEDNVVFGRGHRTRDIVTLMFPPTTIYQLFRIPSRGPKLVIDNETAMTIKLLEPVSLGGRTSSANQDASILRARIDELEKTVANLRETAELSATPATLQQVERPPDDVCFKIENVAARALVGGMKVTRPVRNLTPYHVSIYLNNTPVAMLPPCYGPSMIETPPTEFRLEAVAGVLTRAGQNAVSLDVVPTGAGWDIVLPPAKRQSPAN
jgi:hypothetical protein